MSLAADLIPIQPKAWRVRWKRMFETGKYASLADLAAAEKINASYL